MKMRYSLSIMLALSGIASADLQRFEVNNPSEVPLTSAIVQLDVSQFDFKAEEYIVKDSSGKELVTQLDGTNLLFQSDFKALEAVKFEITSGKSKVDHGDRSTFARLVPERADDFAWENDYIAFRTYGPALRESNEDSGIDAWLKRVNYPIIDKWYKLHLEEKVSYHKDHGEGHDPYHVGKSRGTGGTAIVVGNDYLTSNTFTRSEVECNGPLRSRFTLFYEYDYKGGKVEEAKTITIDLGQHVFHSSSMFTQDGKPIDLTAAVGITTHDGKGQVSNDKSWMSVWESIKGAGPLGVGVVFSENPEFDTVKVAARDESHIWGKLNTGADGKFDCYIGFGWVKANTFKDKADWENYLASFRAQLEKPLEVKVLR